MSLPQHLCIATVIVLLGIRTKADVTPDDAVVGPALGHVDHDSARIWLRAPAEGVYRLTISGIDRVFEATADDDHDRCIVWEIEGLAPDQIHTYSIDGDGGVLISGPSLMLKTAPTPQVQGRAVLAFGSCADSEPSSVWSAIELQGAEGLVLLGDTPYIDSRDLGAARAAHRRFLQVPELARLARSTPIWGTWDDHDFGGNDVDGRMTGKEHTRRAFVEYRAHTHFGENGEGIYTSFRRGPVEVFLIDARWFARTATLSEDDDRWTLLGEQQWAWLENGLATSTAPFKILATGMIWDDKQNAESDDWGAFPHERARLERFIGDHGISGCILMGGDIHVSRHLSYPQSATRAGYVLDQLIVSPLHDRTIASLNVPHPALVWSAVEPHVFLMVEADTTGERSTLTARWIQDTGKGAGRELYRVVRTLNQLTAPTPPDDPS